MIRYSPKGRGLKMQELSVHLKGFVEKPIQFLKAYEIANLNNISSLDFVYITLDNLYSADDDCWVVSFVDGSYIA